MKMESALLALVLASAPVQAQTTRLLVLDKRDSSLVMVDPTTLKIVGRAPAGPDPHEVVASPDGHFAYISNYGGTGSSYHTLSVVDLTTQQALPAVDLGPLHSAHGLQYVGGKVSSPGSTSASWRWSATSPPARSPTR